MTEMKCRDRVTRVGHRPFRWGLLLIAVVLAAAIAPVQAAPILITGTFRGTDVGRSVTYTYAGTTTTNWAGSLLLDIDNGPTVHVFCIQILVAVRPGDRYKNDGPVQALPGGCQIQYLLEHYPAATATTPDEAAARQLAIWVFSDGLDPTTITDAVVRNRTIALVGEARLGQCPPQRIEAPDLTLSPPSASATVGQSVTYTVQAGAQDAGASVSLTVTGPATFVGGQQQSSVTLNAQGTATFQVQIAGSGAVTVNASLPYQLMGGLVFSHLDPNIQTQRLVIAGTLDRIATAGAQLTATAPTATAVPTAVPAPQPTEEPTAEPPPPPTRRPSQSRPTAQPIEATPTAEQPAAIEQPTVITQPTQIAPDQAAGGSAPLPASLPNTGDSTGDRYSIIGGLVAVLLIGGWLLRKRGARF